MKVMFYNAYIQSTFDYCCPIWGKGKQTQTLLEKSQKRIAGIILTKKSSEIDENTLKQMKWLTFEKRCIYHTGMLIYKANTNLAPKYIGDLIEYANNEHYNLRSSKHKDIKTIAFKTNYLKTSFAYNSKLIWNKIPLHIRNLPKISTFKKHFKKYLSAL